MTSELLKFYLTPEGMATARAALVARFPWFLHVSEKRHLGSIRSRGLEPRNPGCPAPNEVGQNTIVCFRPMGTFNTTPNRGELRFLVAVTGNDLTPTIGLDWSYGGCWNLADLLHAQDPNRPPENIFCEVVRRFGSVVTYEQLSPSTLRVWTKGTNCNNPETWPLLSETRECDIEIF